MRVAVFQSAGGGQTLEQKLTRLKDAVKNARSGNGDGPELIVCPELFASGYNVGDQLLAAAELPTGPTFRRVAELAKKLRCAIVYGYPESGDNCLFNSAAFVSADGELLVNHRKRLNSPGSFEEDYFTPGMHPTRLEYRGIEIAILICYEVEFPETVRNAALDGAQLVLVPTALVDRWGVVADAVVPARAFENGVWLAYANHAGHENGFDYLGGSKIVAPDGRIMAAANGQEALISATVDIDRVATARQRLPYLRDCSRLGAAT